MDDLQVKLAEARERRARLEKLLAAADRSAEAARVLLAQESTYPRPRRAIESELHAAEMDLRWIGSDLAALVSRERVLEADLASIWAEELELAAAEVARAAKVAKGKTAIRPPRKTEASSDN